MKKISNNDLIRKLDYTPNQKPAFVSNVKSINDLGFRMFVADVIKNDEGRKSDFLKKVIDKNKF